MFTEYAQSETHGELNESNYTAPKPANQTLINTGLKLVESQTRAQGKFASFVREHILQGNYSVILGVFNASLEKHGQKGDEVNGKCSTPTDAVRSTVDNVTKALIGNVAYPFEGALGIRKVDGEYTLVDKGPKIAKSNDLEKSMQRVAKKFKTDAEKRAALAAFTKALGL